MIGGSTPLSARLLSPEIAIEPDKREPTKVVNIMDALKKSMKGREPPRVRDVVGKRARKPAPKTGSGYLTTCATI